MPYAVYAIFFFFSRLPSIFFILLILFRFYARDAAAPRSAKMRKMTRHSRDVTAISRSSMRGVLPCAAAAYRGQQRDYAVPC